MQDSEMFILDFRPSGNFILKTDLVAFQEE